ncbi:MAG: ComEC/Rec2 family competence protein [Clostridia bacterium]|nr:ComEC/Rec2 family competence protein [Clostridia bacterium]
MELFRGRYLCFLSFLFLLISLVCFKLESGIKLALIILFTLLCVIAVIVLILNKKHRFVAFVALLSIVAMLLAALSSFFFVSLPNGRAEKYCGRYIARLEILSQEIESEHSSEYYARMLNAGGEDTRLKVYLICDFPSALEQGDQIIATVDTNSLAPRDLPDLDDDCLLVLNVNGDEGVTYKKADAAAAFSLDGLLALANKLQRAAANYVDEIFGEDAPLVKGMLLNDKSGLSSNTRSQFSRAGAAHLLAVSGLHVSLLLGALELLLKKLLVPKKLRIVVIIIGGALLLALTDFSPSAVRSVFMLFAVYLGFMLSEENDAPTSLFCSVALITLISPHSVNDVGLWLSFSATLGLVVVYPYIERKLPYIEKSKKLSKKLLRLGVSTLKVALIAIVANFFTLPIMWYCFGSASIVAVISNLFLSPLTAIFLPLCVVSLALGKLAFIGEGVVFVTALISRAMLLCVKLMANIRFGVISLEYPFAAPLVIVFSIAMSVLLVIKLRKKLWICLPPISFVAAFALCLGIFAFADKGELKYVGVDSDEIFIAERAGVCSVCDVTDGSAWNYWQLRNSLPAYAVEIEDYVVSHPHKRHAELIKRISEHQPIRNIYLPLIEDSEELGYISEIVEVAQKGGINICFYESGELLELVDGMYLRSFFERGMDGHSSVYMSFYKNGDSFTYTDNSKRLGAYELGQNSRYMLFGAHGRRSAGDKTPIPTTPEILFATRKSAPEIEGVRGRLVAKDSTIGEFSIVLG